MARHTGHAALATRRKRRKTRGKFKIKVPHWQDPTPWIPGTEPEKRTFEALVRHGFYFWFQEDPPFDLAGSPATLTRFDFIPDFILPEWKIIFDPFGDFHHSLPQARANDAWKKVAYEAEGYEFVYKWASEVNTLGGEWFISQSQRLFSPPMFKLTDPKDIALKIDPGYRLGAHLGLGASSVGIANKKRARGTPLGLGSSR